MKAFYLGYPGLLPIGHAVRGESHKSLVEKSLEIGHAVRGFSGDWKPEQLNPSLSWMHYRALLKADRVEARSFYEIVPCPLLSLDVRARITETFTSKPAAPLLARVIRRVFFARIRSLGRVFR